MIPVGVEHILAAIGAADDGRAGPVLVAIAGRGGAGKSTLAATIARRLGGAQVVHTDDFAGPDDAATNRTRLRREVLEPLSAGSAGRYRRWDWDTKTLAEWHDVRPHGVVIVEGVSATALDLWDAWDCTIWVDTPKHVRIARGVARDGEHMRSTWMDEWEPQEDAYVARERPDARADFVIDGAEPY